MSSEWLNERRSTVTSQNGEDGVLAAIFEKIGTANKWCCEFGAWDGVHLSNTNTLIQNGWSSVQIEGDISKFVDLTRNFHSFRKVTKVYAQVTPEGITAAEWQSELRDIADRVTESLRAVDPASTDEMIEKAHAADVVEGESPVQPPV